jgi:hypothetical protein
MKKLYLFLLSLCVLASCDQDSAEPSQDYPVTFATKKIINTGPIRMYTSHGEVLNAARAKAFASIYATAYHLEDKETELDIDQKFTLRSESEAEVSQRGSVTAFEIGQVDGMLQLTSTEENTILETAGSEYLTNLQAAISRYKPLQYDKQPLAPTTGYTYSYKTKGRFYASIKSDELHLGRMIFTLKRSNSHGGFSVVTSGSSNFFDPSGVSMLHAGDTLIVQSFINVAVKE